MNDQATINYERIASAIAFIQLNFQRQPSLEEIAVHVNLSPFHFQRLFQEWAGTTPKKMLQYTSLAYAKSLLQSSPQPSLFDTTHALGFSSTSRLHDLFVSLEAMTPGEFKNGGQALQIQAAFYSSVFGRLLMANTPKGICFLSFGTSDHALKAELLQTFPLATFRWEATEMHQNVLKVFGSEVTSIEQIRLHLKGSAFQLKVWEALLKIPRGNVESYKYIAEHIHQPSASRAVGTAIGTNPIAYLIPCHRVIQTSGKLGGYRWGLPRKSVMIAWEGIQLSEE